MSRNESAFHRSVKARLAKMGAADKYDAAVASNMYDAWAKPAQVAAVLAAPLRVRLCTPVSVAEAASLLA